LQAILDKRLGATILWICVAVSMHYSSVIFVPFCLFACKGFDLSIKNIKVCSLSALLFIPFYMIGLDFFIDIFPQYGRHLLYGGAENTQEVGLLYLALFSILGLLLLLYILPLDFDPARKVLIWNGKGRFMEETPPEEQQTFFLFTLLFVLYVVFYVISRDMLIIGRFLFSFNGSLVIFVPNLLYFLEKKYRIKNLQYALAVPFVLYFLVYGYHHIVSNGHRILPYTFFFQ